MVPLESQFWPSWPPGQVGTQEVPYGPVHVTDPEVPTCVSPAPRNYSGRTPENSPTVLAKPMMQQDQEPWTVINSGERETGNVETSRPCTAVVVVVEMVVVVEDRITRFCLSSPHYLVCTSCLLVCLVYPYLHTYMHSCTPTVP